MKSELAHLENTNQRNLLFRKNSKLVYMWTFLHGVLHFAVFRHAVQARNTSCCLELARGFPCCTFILVCLNFTEFWARLGVPPWLFFRGRTLTTCWGVPSFPTTSNRLFSLFFFFFLIKLYWYQKENLGFVSSHLKGSNVRQMQMSVQASGLEAFQ